ncbi:MAG: efflux RND transporter periplasmic adaptor subunit [Cyclobacteriaceae bacterium]|nr:efflux RND transporter periplasmic adaptor subunit [Cyclobacteriaceae bacterium]
MRQAVSVLPLFLLATVILGSCKKEQKKDNPSSSLDESSIAVNLVAVREMEHSLPVVSSGLIATETESRLSFKVGGVIKDILVKEGQSVTKGQLLASLDLTEIDAQVSQAKNSLDKTKRDLERGQRLFKDSAATLEQIQNLQTAAQVADESYRIASFNRLYSTIRATNSGKVIRKFLSEGELASPGAPVLIVNSSAQDEWIVKIGLPDVDWVRVRSGDRAKISVDAYPDVALDAEVQTVNEGADALSGLYQAEVKIRPGKYKLATGLFARVEILPSVKLKLKSIPIEALLEGSGKNAYVFVVGSSKTAVNKIPVQVAYLHGKQAFISGGLENVQEVITSGSAFLTENSVITITQK